MKRLYEKYFRVPAEGTVHDRVMLTRVAVTVVLMVIYLVAISASAYAYFACGTVADSNSISVAHFDILAVVREGDGNGSIVPYDPVTNTVKLTPGVKYTVVINDESANPASTGFCEVYVAKHVVYHTRQFLRNTDDALTFTLEVESPAAEPVAVRIVPHWGTSSKYPAYAEFLADPGNHAMPALYIVDGAAVKLSADTGASVEVGATTTVTTITTTTTEATTSATEATTAATTSTEATTTTGSTEAATTTGSTEATTAATTSTEAATTTAAAQN